LNGGVEVAKKLLTGTGKYLVFLLLNGLGGIIVAAITTSVIVHNFDWIFGQPKTGTTYGAVVEVVGAFGD
jgi:hypothetical protein